MASFFVPAMVRSAELPSQTIAGPDVIDGITGSVQGATHVTEGTT